MQLHQPAHATVAAVTGTASLPRRCSSRRQGRFLSQLAPRPLLTLRPAIRRFLSGPIREERSEGLRYYVRANTTSSALVPGRYRAPDPLLAFLEAL